LHFFLSYVWYCHYSLHSLLFWRLILWYRYCISLLWRLLFSHALFSKLCIVVPYVYTASQYPVTNPSGYSGRKDGAISTTTMNASTSAHTSSSSSSSSSSSHTSHSSSGGGGGVVYPAHISPAPGMIQSYPNPILSTFWHLNIDWFIWFHDFDFIHFIWFSFLYTIHPCLITTGSQPGVLPNQDGQPTVVPGTWNKVNIIS
jgi:hypothetical protein